MAMENCPVYISHTNYKFFPYISTCKLLKFLISPKNSASLRKRLLCDVCWLIQELKKKNFTYTGNFTTLQEPKSPVLHTRI